MLTLSYVCEGTKFFIPFIKPYWPSCDGETSVGLELLLYLFFMSLGWHLAKYGHVFLSLFAKFDLPMGYHKDITDPNSKSTRHRCPFYINLMGFNLGEIGCVILKEITGIAGMETQRCWQVEDADTTILSMENMLFLFVHYARQGKYPLITDYSNHIGKQLRMQ